MKTNTGIKATTSKATTHQNRAENKDNLDSRKNEEFEVKGDDVTHNTKEHKSENKKTKSED